MAFSFAELLKRQFPLAGVEAYTGSPKRMPESSPFPSESASGALSMGGLVDALGGVSMADYFNNDNWETRQVEGVSKRGEMVDRQYRMNPGDKTTIKVGNDGKIVETTERTTGDLFSEQPNRRDYPVQVSLPSQRGSEFDPRMSGDLFPQQPVINPIQLPNDTAQSEMSRIPGGAGIDYPFMMGGVEGLLGDPLPAPPVQQGMQDEIGRIMMSNDISKMIPSRSRMPTNTVYPRPTTRSMYNRPVNSPDFIGSQGSVNNTGYRGTYGVPMYGQARPTSAQTYPSNPLPPLATPTLIENQSSDIDMIGMDDEERRRMMDMLVGLMLERSD
jgi:hypothetical protein